MNTRSIVSTTVDLNQFSGEVVDLWGNWALSHETTCTGLQLNRFLQIMAPYIGREQRFVLSLPMDLAITDPKAIGAVATEVLDEVGKLSLNEQVGQASSTMTEEQGYQDALKASARKYKKDEELNKPDDSL